MSTNPNPGFALESWVLYGIGAGSVILRLISRARRAGVKNLQLDDAFVLFGLLWYTVLCIAFNEMLKGAGSNLMTGDEIAALTPEIHYERVKGSKWVFVSEHAMLLTIWAMKAAMLVLYARVTEGLAQRKMLNGVIIWVVISFIGDEIALFTICRPVNQYWAVPVENVQCATYQYYQIVNAVFNISTDVMLLAVGLPPILKARLSIQQKAILAIVLGMGSFIVVAAILRAIYCLVPSLISYVYMNWYFREASVAVYVTNAPAIWILLRDIFPSLQRLGQSSRRTTSAKPTGHAGAYLISQTDTKISTHPHHNWVKMGGSRVSAKEADTDLEEWPINSRTQVHATRSFHDTSSPEHCRKDSTDLHKSRTQDDDSVSSSNSNPFSNLEIRRDVTFTVEHDVARQNV